jgi:hypothetical protein
VGAMHGVGSATRPSMHFRSGGGEKSAPNAAESTGRGNTSIANLHRQALEATGIMHRTPSVHWPDIAEARPTDLGPIKDIHKQYPHR